MFQSTLKSNGYKAEGRLKFCQSIAQEINNARKLGITGLNLVTLIRPCH